MTVVNTEHSKALQPLWDNLRRWAKTRLVAKMVQELDYWWLNALNPNNYGPEWIAQNLVSKWELIESLLATLPETELASPDLVDLELRIHKIIDLQVRP